MTLTTSRTTTMATAMTITPTIAATMAPTTNSIADDSGDGEEAPPEPRGKAPKLRKDGKAKQSGLSLGAKRGISHTKCVPAVRHAKDSSPKHDLADCAGILRTLQKLRYRNFVTRSTSSPSDFRASGV